MLLWAAFILGLWKVFVKAGEPGWKVFVPVTNVVTLCKISGRQNGIFKMDSYADEKTPFFLWHNFWGPHEPCFVTESFYALYKDTVIPPWPNFHYRGEEQNLAWQQLNISDAEWERWQQLLRYYYAFTTFIDKQIGRLLDHLERTGLDKTTMILFTGDHGQYTGQHGGLFNKGWGHFEEILRIPFIVTLPPLLRDGNALKGGTVLSHYTSLVDIYPTILECAGIPYDSSFTHGDSVIPLLQGRTIPWRDTVCSEIFSLGHIPTTQITCRSGALKYGFNFGGKDELYDLEQDPYEMDNRIDDPHYEENVSDLRNRIVAWMETTHFHPHGIREYKRSRLA